jgi:hypothetical protein
MRSLTRATLLALCAAVLLSGCFPGSGHSTPAKPAGFFMGVWHGWIAPISLVGEFFNPALRVYEQANTGFGYDLGFYCAVISGFGGFALFRGRGKRE